MSLPKKKSFNISVFVEALILTLSILIFGFVDYQQSKYTGIWRRNNETTDAGKLSINSVPVQLEIKEIEGEMLITRTSKDRFDSTFVYIEKLSKDGSKNISIPRPGLKKTSSIEMIANSSDFVDAASYTDKQGVLKQKVRENWSLIEGGKTLKIIVEIIADNQTYSLIEIFDKQ